MKFKEEIIYFIITIIFLCLISYVIFNDSSEDKPNIQQMTDMVDNINKTLIKQQKELNSQLKIMNKDLLKQNKELNIMIIESSNQLIF